jgi:hypothetical protein
MGWICPAQNKVKWLPLVSTVIKRQVPRRPKRLNSWATLLKKDSTPWNSTCNADCEEFMLCFSLHQLEYVYVDKRL